MRMWEYMTKDISFGDIDKHMNEYGKVCWEAVAVDWNYRPAFVLVLFKRSTGKE